MRSILKMRTGTSEPIVVPTFMLNTCALFSLPTRSMLHPPGSRSLIVHALPLPPARSPPAAEEAEATLLLVALFPIVSVSVVAYRMTMTAAAAPTVVLLLIVTVSKYARGRASESRILWANQRNRHRTLHGLLGIWIGSSYHMSTTL